jgi:HemK-like putative methylase
MLTSRANFELCDILSEIPNGKYDIITSNPPYIRTEVIDGLQTEVEDFEPHLALDGGEDGLKFYRRICDIAPHLLTKGGNLVFEIGYDQADEVSSLMEKNFTDVSVIKDLCGNDRVVVGTLK